MHSFLARQGWLNLLPSLAYSLLTLPRLAGHGMFLDGVTYAAIARNMAMSKGSLFSPFYTETLYPRFFEQPGLGLFIESLFFRLAGDRLWVEKAFSFACGLLTLALIMYIARHLFSRRPAAPAAAGLAWALMPGVSWSYSNNMLETLATPVILTAFVFFLPLLTTLAEAGPESPPATLKLPVTVAARSAVAGVLAALAFFIKGPVLLFIVAVPAAAWLALERTEKIKAFKLCLLSSLAALAGCLLVFGLAMLHDTASHSLTSFMNSQVLASLEGRREKAGSMFDILRFLGGDLLVAALGLYLLRGITTGRWQVSPPLWQHRVVLLTGLCGSLPLLLSPKQAHWYLLPALPFFSLHLSNLFVDADRVADNSAEVVGVALKRPAVVAITALVLLAAIPVAIWSGSRKINYQRAFYRNIAAHLEREPFLKSPGSSSAEPAQAVNGPAMWSVCPKALTRNWDWVAVMQRHYGASLKAAPQLTPGQTAPQGLYLVDSKKCGGRLKGLKENGCERLNPSTARYKVFRCKGPAE